MAVTCVWARTTLGMIEASEHRAVGSKRSSESSRLQAVVVTGDAKVVEAVDAAVGGGDGAGLIGWAHRAGARHVPAQTRSRDGVSERPDGRASREAGGRHCHPKAIEQRLVDRHDTTREGRTAHRRRSSSATRPAPHRSAPAAAPASARHSPPHQTTWRASACPPPPCPHDCR